MKKTKKITKESLIEFYEHLLEIVPQEQKDLWVMTWDEYRKKYPLVDYADYCRAVERNKYNLNNMAYDHFESYK